MRLLKDRLPSGPLGRCLLLLTFALQACTTAVTHPTKSEPEMAADIKRCKGDGREKFWTEADSWNYAYDCLASKGYTVLDRSGQAVSTTQADAKRSETERPLPCRVPCKPRGSKSP